MTLFQGYLAANKCNAAAVAFIGGSLTALADDKAVKADKAPVGCLEVYKTLTITDACVAVDKLDDQIVVNAKARKDKWKIEGLDGTDIKAALKKWPSLKTVWEAKKVDTAWAKSDSGPGGTAPILTGPAVTEGDNWIAAINSAYDAAKAETIQADAGFETCRMKLKEIYFGADCIYGAKFPETWLDGDDWKIKQELCDEVINACGKQFHALHALHGAYKLSTYMVGAASTEKTEFVPAVTDTTLVELGNKCKDPTATACDAAAKLALCKKVLWKEESDKTAALYLPDTVAKITTALNGATAITRRRVRRVLSETATTVKRENRRVLALGQVIKVDAAGVPKFTVHKDTLANYEKGEKKAGGTEEKKEETKNFGFRMTFQVALIALVKFLFF